MNHTTLQPFGVEVTDIDLSRPRTAEENAGLLALFNEHYLLVVRDQNLSDDDHLRVFHDLFPGEDLGDETGTGSEISFVSNVRADGIFGDAALAFHSDFSFTTDPTRLISLYGLEVDPGSAPTEFSNGELALHALPADLRAYLQDKKVVSASDLMAFSSHIPSFNLPGREDLSGRPHEEVVRASWPVIMNHPRTGRPLIYVNELHAHHLHGIPLAEGRDALEKICHVLYKPEHIYSHDWRQGDFVLWDNIALSHGRRATAAKSAKRTLRRVRGGGASTPIMVSLSQYGLDDVDGKRSPELKAQMLTVGKRLRDARLARGLSQRELSDATQIEFQHIAMCETGLRMLPAADLRNVAKSLGMGETDLVEGIPIEATA